MKSKKPAVSAYRICLIALAICINIVGGNIALMLKLPIYLDSIGTFFIAATCGPVYGMLPNLLSGIIMGMTTDIYSLYFAPVGMALGLVTGIVWKKCPPKGFKIILTALLIMLPTSLLSASISAYLFGGVTSSGSTVLVQLLAKTPVGMVLSVFLVQAVTDYADRLISIFLVKYLIKVLPSSIMNKIMDPSK